MAEFHFNEATHTYTLDGVKMTGTTTVLGMIAKPMLIQWAANMAIDYVEANASKEAKETNGVYLVTGETLKEARTAHIRTRDKRAEEGTNTHALVEEYVKACIEKKKGLATKRKVKDKQLAQFIDWAVENKVKFLASEKVMYHPEWFVGGTTDLVFEIDGKLYVADIKTSKSVYYEAHVQMAAYRAMLESMGYKGFHGSVIIHLPPKGKLTAHFHYDHETNLKVFEAALTIYRAKAMYDTLKFNNNK